MTKLIIDFPKDTKFEDTELRNYIQRLETKIETLNSRTKNHTLEIKQLQSQLKKK